MSDLEAEKKRDKPALVRDLLLVGASALAGYAGSTLMQDRVSEEQAEIARKDRAQQLYEEYESLADISRSAGDFAKGTGGREQDFVKMFRHFRKVTTLIATDRVDAWSIADLYQGRLEYWSDMFALAAKSEDAVHWTIGEPTLRQIEATAGFLAVLRERSVATREVRSQEGGQVDFEVDAEAQRALEESYAEGCCAAEGCAAWGEDAACEAAE